jgi:hypothetical protein
VPCIPPAKKSIFIFITGGFRLVNQKIHVYFKKMRLYFTEKDNQMILCVNFLCAACGSHEKAADYIGYSIRQYRDIRRKIEMGETVPPRTENLIRAKARELQQAGGNNVVQ